ncbi:metalloendopeptidase OMA1, mitochondrial-like [Haliotis rufescens]|uniref:metalloendopeptidase OMA1, mitochondrial-like n=1 Tax=Haliotis rufescens TaxID=6454 RepID=UPI00201FB14A|nr:metalloendopeptidase OMA1, mitochondrial-like [Haliotis rufescens]
MLRSGVTVLPRGVGHLRLNFGMGSQVVFSHVRQFQTSPRRPIPPIFLIMVKPIVKIGAALTGRGVRKWWQRLPSEEKRSIWTRVKQSWPVFALMGGAGAGWGWYYYQSHMVATPITNRKRFMMFTHDQMMKISKARAQVELDRYQERLVPVEHPAFQKILKIATRLVESNPDLMQMDVDKWRISVVDSPDVNAFVVPHGHIFVFMGMTKIATNEDQMAIVLGHEMAHTLLSHAAENMSVAQLFDVAIIAVMGAIWTIMPNDGIALVTQWFYNRVLDILLCLPYSRKLEKEADKVGMQLAARACYDVREGSIVWKKFQISEDLGDDAQTPEWLSTHPANLKRAEHLDFLVPEAIKLRASCNCKPLPAEDPRSRHIALQQYADDKMVAKKAGQDLRLVARKGPSLPS